MTTLMVVQVLAGVRDAETASAQRIVRCQGARVCVKCAAWHDAGKQGINVSVAAWRGLGVAVPIGRHPHGKPITLQPRRRYYL